MSANEDDDLCNLFENLMDLRKTKTDYRRLGLSQNLEVEDEDEEKTLLTSLPEIISGMYSSDLTRIFISTKSLRRMLTKQSNPPTEMIIEAGLVNLLVIFLGCDDKPILQCEAARALIDIASGTSQQTCAVVQAGAVPHLIHLLASPHVDIVNNSVWALGNIIADSAELRNFVIENGILIHLMRLVDMNATVNFLRTVTWVILNLCCNNQSPPKLETINACLSALRILIRHTDYDVLSDTCWAFYYVLNGPRDFIQQAVESPGVLSRLVELLGNPEPCVIIPALQTIGKIVVLCVSQTQALIDCNVLQMLPALLQHPDVYIMKRACWLLFIITFQLSSSEQIQAVINCNLLPLIVEVLKTGDFKRKWHATWVFINLTRIGTLEQINYVVQCGALKILCDLLTTKETKLLNIHLDVICSILEATNKFGQVEYLYVMLKEIGGLDKIEKLQNHEDIQIKCKSCSIIHKFF